MRCTWWPVTRDIFQFVHNVRIRGQGLLSPLLKLLDGNKHQGEQFCPPG